MTRTTIRTAASVVLPATALLFLSCAENDTETSEKIERVKENPTQYYGKDIQATGNIEEVYNPTAFVLESEDPFFGEEILVLSRTPMALGAANLQADSKVRVSGKVRQLVITELERELGWDFDTHIEAEFDSKPVIVAQSIVSAASPELSWTEAEAGEQFGDGLQPAITNIVVIVDAVQPTDLIGRSFDLDSLEVRAVDTDEAFWVGSDEQNQMLVVLGSVEKIQGTDESVVHIQEGQIIDLQGTLREMPETEKATREWKLKADEDMITNRSFYLEADRVFIRQQADK